MKEIHIQPVMNGFIVKVGCTKVVFTDIDGLCRDLKRYHLNPESVEAEYQKEAINKTEAPAIAMCPEDIRLDIDATHYPPPTTATEAIERSRR
jgi:hypothetical protein